MGQDATGLHRRADSVSPPTCTDRALDRLVQGRLLVALHLEGPEAGIAVDLPILRQGLDRRHRRDIGVKEVKAGVGLEAQAVIKATIATTLEAALAVGVEITDEARCHGSIGG